MSTPDEPFLAHTVDYVEKTLYFKYMSNMKAILDDIRGQERHSFQHLANISGLSKSYIAKIFRDECTPIPYENESFKKILDIYGLPYVDISHDRKEDRTEGHRLRQLKEKLMYELGLKTHGCNENEAIAPVVQAITSEFFISDKFEKLNKEQFMAHLCIEDFFHTSDYTLRPGTSDTKHLNRSLWEYLSCYDQAIIKLKDLIRINLDSVVYCDGIFKIKYLNKEFSFGQLDPNKEISVINELYIKDKKFKKIVDAAYEMTQQ